MRSRKTCRGLTADKLTDEELERSTWDRFGPIAEAWSRSMKKRMHDAHVPPSKAQLLSLLNEIAPGLVPSR